MAKTWWDRRRCRTTPIARTPSWSAHCVAWSMLLACSWDSQFSWSPTSPFPWLQQASSQHLCGHFISCATAGFWILERLASSTDFTVPVAAMKESLHDPLRPKSRTASSGHMKPWQAHAQAADLLQNPKLVDHLLNVSWMHEMPPHDPAAGIDQEFSQWRDSSTSRSLSQMDANLAML
jgi:hypothetical protein